jgi:threonine aldolase
MPTYRFFDDYSEGAHPRVLDVLADSNLRQEPGYGHDGLTARAIELLRAAIGNASAAVHLVSGGTQTNLIALASMLRPFESVIAAESAHIAVHETGAIEATGHKVHVLPSRDGKLHADAIRACVAQHRDEHMVRPRVVFVSQPTELGTLYAARELEDVARACRELDLVLYLDGARLPAALASPACDLPLPRLAALVDAFYLGGTKNGALLGEALVLCNPALQEDFRFHLKQRGALLAKGRVLGAQFAALLEDDLYLQLARHANAMAARLVQGLHAAGVKFLGEPVTNQVFPILPDRVVEALGREFGFHVWSRVDPAHSAIRLVTSWATPEWAVDALLATLERVR